MVRLTQREENILLGVVEDDAPQSRVAPATQGAKEFLAALVRHKCEGLAGGHIYVVVGKKAATTAGIDRRKLRVVGDGVEGQLLMREGGGGGGEGGGGSADDAGGVREYEVPVEVLVELFTRDATTAGDKTLSCRVPCQQRKLAAATHHHRPPPTATHHHPPPPEATTALAATSAHATPPIYAWQSL